MTDVTRCGAERLCRVASEHDGDGMPARALCAVPVLVRHADSYRSTPDQDRPWGSDRYRDRAWAQYRPEGSDPSPDEAWDPSQAEA